MADTRLRDLERRYKESGSVADKAAWLMERVRVGELTDDRLRVAALLGDAASQEALSEARRSLGLQALAKALPAVGKEPCARVAVAATRFALLSYSAPERELVEPALAAAEAWLLCPCLEHLNRCAEHWWNLRPGEGAAWLAAVMVCLTAYDPEGFGPLETEEEAEELGAMHLELFPELVEAARPFPGVTTAIRDEVVPWALGYGDPIEPE